MTLWIKADAYRRLGLINLFRALWYRLKLKSGHFEKQLPVGDSVTGSFYAPTDFSKAKIKARREVVKETDDTTLFGWHALSLGQLPDWHRSVLNENSLENNHQHWSLIADFSSGVGDIKGVWEPSRFTWILNLVANYLSTQDIKDLETLNNWVTDWSEQNPVNSGANWKCAQEASFRVMHLAAGALLLEQRTPSNPMAKIVKQHLQRIAPTLGYAKAQDNNHGTSEAAAMFVGASWLLQIEPEDTELQFWYRMGREYLAERMLRLVMSDGSFSQYSVTYHRVMLDTYSLAELWRRYLALPAFPKSVIERAAKAARWLYLLTEPESGDAPNLGTNDGAHILNYLDVEYRDFRPTVELASMLFADRTAYSGSLHQGLCHLFSLPTHQRMLSKPKVKAFRRGGYGLLFSEHAWCCLRVPTFQFRPAQADNLHLDLWVKGQNVLRDGGSYSYNTEQKWLDYFNQGEGHNTVQFDNRQSMPKVSRFLFGQWPQYSQFSVSVEGKERHLQAAYTDWKGAVHKRQVILTPSQLTVVDEIDHFSEIACLRWRLSPGDWQVEGNTITLEGIRIEVSANVPIQRLALAKGYESRYYGRKKAVPVLEVDVKQNAQITTTIHWT